MRFKTDRRVLTADDADGTDDGLWNWEWFGMPARPSAPNLSKVQNLLSQSSAQSAVKMVIGENGRFLTTDYTDVTDDGFGVGMEDRSIQTCQRFNGSYPNHPRDPRSKWSSEKMEDF